MKILYLKKSGSSNTLQTFIKEQGKENTLFFVDLNVEKNYEKLVRLIEECEKVISW